MKYTTGYEIEDSCKDCNRDGFYHTPRVDLQLVYENLDPDFNKYNVFATHELFGTSCLKEPFSESVFANPKLLISEKVVAVLKSESIKTDSFKPVKIRQPDHEEKQHCHP